jgi:hypothetical protein
MKKYIIMLISILFSISAYAQKPILELTVINHSEQKIVLHKSDGATLTLLPGETKNNINFARFSDVENYIGNKQMCTWKNLNDYTSECLVISELVYDGTCKTYYTQQIPC